MSMTDKDISQRKVPVQGRNVIVLRTFSRSMAIGEIGYGITTPEIAALVNRVREPFNVNLLAQTAAIGALADREHLQKSRELNLQGRDFLYREFSRLGLEYVPTEANFIFVDIRRDCRQVFQALLKEGVIIRTGDIFGYPTYIRVTIGKPEENQRFIAALDRVLQG